MSKQRKCGQYKSTNLFLAKCNYANVGRLNIVFHLLKLTASPPKTPLMEPFHLLKLLQKTPFMEPSVKIEKVSLEQAVSLYRNCLSGKEFFPMNDIEAILGNELNLGNMGFISQP